MKRHTETIERVTFASDVMPEVMTTDARYAQTIEWADANPVVWKIVTQNKSAPFGRESSTYMGCQRGKDPGSILSRAHTFWHEMVREFDPPVSQNPAIFWRCRARFTLEHYTDKGFRGGLFQQFDGTYHRSCTYLDYTPETLELVIERFVAWCDAGPNKFPTVGVRVDGKMIKRFKKAP